MSERRAAVAGNEGPLAIICGGGSLPFAVAEAARRQGRSVILFALRGLADRERVETYPHYWTRLGQFGGFCRKARQAGCRDVVFIGSAVRPSLWQIWPDLAAIRVFPRIIAALRGGDDHLMTGLMKIFEENGFRPLGAHEVAPDILLPEGALGSLQPSSGNRDDIALGLSLLHATGPFDVGQAAVVAGGQVLAIEAADGTDGMLAHLAELRRRGRIRTRGGVLVKAPKPGQDQRIDLPTIGPQTVEGAARAGLEGVAAIAGGTIIAEPEAVRQAAERARIFVVGVSEQGAARGTRGE
jgi:DUF1009 family protein